MIWSITGKGLPELLIKALSFDGALEIARKIDKGYNTGQVKEVE